VAGPAGILAGADESEGYPIGEYKLSGIEFTGSDLAQARRKALDFWYNNREHLGLSLRDFFALCRMRDEGRTIVFLAHVSQASSQCW
jgi:hypothetical protein